MAAPLKVHTVLRLAKLFPLKGNVERLCPALFQRHFNTSTTESSIAQQFKQATEAQHTGRSICRTPESNPAAHSSAHEGLYYTIPDDEVKIFDKAFEINFHRMRKAFCETSVMIRKPAVEVIECMKAANYNLPAVRYLLYGYLGCGKTMSLGHIIHYCAKEDFLLLHVPWAAHWNRYYREAQVSAYNPERFDEPIVGTEWLTQFRKMNEPKLKELDIRLQNRYVWNKRESSEAGTSVLEAIEYGLSRSKYACDIVGLVLKELREQTMTRGFKILVAVDGVNAFWETSTIRRTEDKSYVASKDLTMTHNFLKMLRNDWAGGAVVCTVDSKAGSNYDNSSAYTPLHLLGKEGFEWLDPFIPINVPEYSDKEILSNLEYFIEKKWIQNPEGHTEDGKKELIFLSCKNPAELYKVSKTW